MASSGWFADPLGRHEKRFFNGLVWTDRVLDGEQSASDPIGNVAPRAPVGPGGAAGGAPRATSGLVANPNGGNASAIIALILGIVGAGVALLMPFGFLAGAACGLLAVIVGLHAYRNLTGNSDSSNALATGGLLLGLVALLVAVYFAARYYSVASTVRRAFASSTSLVVTDANASRNDIVVTDCYRSGEGSPAATGTLVNMADKKESFRVTIEFRIGAIVVRSDTTTVPLSPGETGSWTVRDIDVSFKPTSCSVVTPAAVSP